MESPGDVIQAVTTKFLSYHKFGKKLMSTGIFMGKKNLIYSQ